MSKSDNSHAANGSQQQTVAQDPTQAMWKSLGDLFPGLLPELKPALVPAKTSPRGTPRGRR